MEEDDLTRDIPVPDGEVSMEDAGEFDGEDTDDMQEITAHSADTEIVADEDNLPDDDVQGDDFELPDPPDDLLDNS